MFSPANEVICFVSTGCSFVKMKSHYLNPNFVLKLLAVTSLSIITVIAHILSITWGLLFDSSVSSYPCFL